jgi:hypothetical protein
MRLLYLIDRKESPSANEVIPHQPEGNPSGQQGITASSTRRNCFQPMRYKELINQQE